MKQKNRWINFIIISAIFYLFISGNRGLWNLYKLHQEKQNLLDQTVWLKTEINRNQLECQALEKNTSILEKQAREELNLVRPNEIVYEFKKSNRQ